MDRLYNIFSFILCINRFMIYIIIIIYDISIGLKGNISLYTDDTIIFTTAAQYIQS